MESALAFNLRVQFDSQVFFRKRFVNGGEFVVAAALDIALPLEVNNHRTLLGLECVMPTRAHEAVDDVIERVVVVVEQDNVPFIVKKDVGQNVFLGEGV